MSRLTAAVAFLASTLPVQLDHANPARVQASHHQGRVIAEQGIEALAIYLVAEPVAGRIVGDGKGAWSHLRVSASPLVSAGDIVDYDWATHAITLRPEALARIPKRLTADQSGGPLFTAYHSSSWRRVSAFTWGSSSRRSRPSRPRFQPSCCMRSCCIPSSRRT